MGSFFRKAGRARSRKRHSGLGARLRTWFLSGLLLTAPAAMTVYTAWLFVDFVDRRVGRILPPRYNPATYLHFEIPGFGLLVLVLFLILVGALTAGLFGRLFVRVSEGIFNRMPVIRSVYGALKQLLAAVLSQSSGSFRQCVLVEYPRRGLWVLGFISSETKGEVQAVTEDEVVSVFVPTTPNPTSGFLMFVPKQDLIVLRMSVEEGIKMVISSGLVAPEFPPPARGDDADADVSPNAGLPPPRPAGTDRAES